MSELTRIDRKCRPQDRDILNAVIDRLRDAGDAGREALIERLRALLDPGDDINRRMSPATHLGGHAEVILFDHPDDGGFVGSIGRGGGLGRIPLTPDDRIRIERETWRFVQSLIEQKLGSPP